MSASTLRPGTPAVAQGGHIVHPQSVPLASSSLLQRFRRDQSGSVAMIFGLMVIPLTAIVGLAVDFGRVYSVHSHTQVALDAAALAAGRVAQVETTNTVAKASAAATSYFNQARPKSVVTAALQFSPNTASTEFTVTATTWVRTPFLGALKYVVSKASDPAAPVGCTGNFFACVQMTTTSTAALAGVTNIEVALMLDVTGSMCDPCSKIEALKPAAVDLIDIVMGDQPNGKVKIALAPFAAAVNVGKTYAEAVRGTVTNNAKSSPQVLNMSKSSSQPTSKWIQFTQADGSGTNTWQISTKCVTERIGNDKYTDAAPSTSTTKVGKAYFGSGDPDDSCVIANYSDDEVNSIQPLSTNKEMLIRRVGKLKTGGSTAGHLGTAWSWYLLSPNWNTIWPSNPAAPYADLTATNANGAPKLLKIAVLMTDGEYNINYCKGVEADNSDQTPDINCNSENGKSLAQATTLCTEMKSPLGSGNAAKIVVFTVGFQVNNTARTFLKNCATDFDHYYDAATGDALRAAFRDIALKISTLRLTH